MTAARDSNGPVRRALVVEDEPNIRELVALHLGLEGLAVAQTGSGDEAVRLSETGEFDIVILDLMLPRMNGIEVCRAIRKQPVNGDVPILMLTAKRDESDKVTGLDSGADDYLTKPFSVRELTARVRALLRRPRQSQAARETAATAAFDVGPMRIDPQRRQTMVNGTVVELTPHEFDVLHLLVRHPGIVFSRETLLARVWTNETHVTERSIDTVVKRLRQKIEADAHDPRLILTVWGTGYKFADA